MHPAQLSAGSSEVLFFLFGVPLIGVFFSGVTLGFALQHAAASMRRVLWILNGVGWGPAGGAAKASYREGGGGILLNKVPNPRAEPCVPLQRAS